MLDDIDKLRADARLLDLLSHYAAHAGPDRQTWTPRPRAIDGIEPKDLTRLHGDLIAAGWVDLNVGVTPIVYRITTAGAKARIEVTGAADDPSAAEPAPPPVARARKKKKDKAAIEPPPEAAAETLEQPEAAGPPKSVAA